LQQLRGSIIIDIGDTDILAGRSARFSDHGELYLIRSTLLPHQSLITAQRHFAPPGAARLDSAGLAATPAWQSFRPASLAVAPASNGARRSPSRAPGQYP